MGTRSVLVCSWLCPRSQNSAWHIIDAYKCVWTESSQLRERPAQSSFPIPASFFSLALPTASPCMCRLHSPSPTRTEVP